MSKRPTPTIIQLYFHLYIYGINHLKNEIFFLIIQQKHEIPKTNIAPIVRHNMEQVFIPQICGIIPIKNI